MFFALAYAAKNDLPMGQAYEKFVKNVENLYQKLEQTQTPRPGTR